VGKGKNSNPRKSLATTVYTRSLVIGHRPLNPS